MVPTHARDIPIRTLRSIERQGESSFGHSWLRGPGGRLS